MTYKEWLDKEQRLVDKLPIFWAFSQKQLDEALKTRNATITDIYRLNIAGGFCLKKDIDDIHAYFDRDNGLERLMSDRDFAIDAFFYEMCNHEYCYNTYQGNWDVLNCFSDKELTFHNDDSYIRYLEEMKHPEWAEMYEEAKRRYYAAAEEGGWF